MRTLFPLVFLFACKDPPPECAPHDAEPYTVCSNDQVWQCADAPADVIAANQAIDDACAQEADPISCTMDRVNDYQYIEMTLVEDCAGGGQVCVEDTDIQVQDATCQDPS